MKLTTVICIVFIVGFSIGFRTKTPDCSTWHNQKVETNEDQARLNAIHASNAWHVVVVPTWRLPGDITELTVDVCKWCGKPTSLSYGWKPKNDNAP